MALLNCNQQMSIFSITGPDSLEKFLQILETYDSDTLCLKFDCFSLFEYNKIMDNMPACVKNLTIFLLAEIQQHSLSIPKTVEYLRVADPQPFNIPKTISKVFVTDKSSFVDKRVAITPSTHIYTCCGSIKYRNLMYESRQSKTFFYRAAPGFEIRAPFDYYIEGKQQQVINNEFLDSLLRKSEEARKEKLDLLIQEIVNLLAEKSAAGSLDESTVIQLDISELNGLDIIPYLQEHVTNRLAFEIIGCMLQVAFA